MKKGLILFLALILIVSSVSALKYYDYQYEGSDTGPNRAGGFYGDGIFGSIDLIEFYYNNQTLVDFFIYLFIFAGLSMAVFKNSFREGHAPLTIGLSIALSLGLILWQNKTGFSFIGLVVGQTGALIIIAAIVFLLVALAAKITGNEGMWFSIFLTATLLCFVILFVMDDYLADFEWGLFLIDIARGLIIPFVILTAIGFFFYNKKKSKRGFIEARIR